MENLCVSASFNANIKGELLHGGKMGNQCFNIYARASGSLYVELEQESFTSRMHSPLGLLSKCDLHEIQILKCRSINSMSGVYSESSTLNLLQRPLVTMGSHGSCSSMHISS